MTESIRAWTLVGSLGLRYYATAALALSRCGSRFFDLNVYALADVQGAVAEVKGEGLIKSTGRMYRRDYVVFLRAADGKIAFLREYFDPVRAAKALDPPIVGLES